jgi:S1/P1 Nuclease
MSCKAIAIGLAIVMYVSSAHAWDDEGHMIVAAIAWKNLDAASRARTSQLLRLNPDYAKWIADIAPDRRDEIAFVTASTWPDAIKRDPGYIFDGDAPSDPAAAQNIGYGDHYQHRYWHYIDVPFSMDGTPLVQPATPNAETQIELFEASLRSGSLSDDVKSYDLVWLEHLVGDVHQPLHATSRFSRQFPAGDRGGNLVALCEKPCRDELHAFWDNVLGTSKSPMTAIAEANRIAVAADKEAAISDDRVWIGESFEAARQDVYAAPVGAGAGPFQLDDRYQQAARAVAQRRVALAGARLANLIKANLR